MSLLCLSHHCILEAGILSGFKVSQLENVASRGIMGLPHPFRHLGEISEWVTILGCWHKMNLFFM